MMAIAIPLFSGTLREKWAPFEDRLHTWLRINRIDSAADQRDVLVFAFPLGSPAASYFLLIPQGIGFHEALGLLRQRFNSDLRQRSIVQAARNSLDLRRFRDDRHRSEMVADLCDELLGLFDLARVTSDADRKNTLQRAFNRFLLAERLIHAALTYDDAVVRVLSWEAQIVAMQADSSPVLPITAPYSSNESLVDANYRGRFKAPDLAVIQASPDRPPRPSEETQSSVDSPKFPLPPTALRPSASQFVRRQRSQSFDERSLRLAHSPSSPEPLRRSNSTHDVVNLPRTPVIARDTSLNRSNSTLKRLTSKFKSSRT